MQSWQPPDSPVPSPATTLAPARPNPPAELGRNIPIVIQLAGARAFERYVDFFVATIRNANTRAAYWRAVQRFFAWCEERQLVELDRIRPVHVSAYIEQMNAAPPTVKQHLAAIRRCLDWLVSGGVLDINPAGSVKGPQHIVREGKTPLLDAEQTRHLLDSIPLHNVVGRRDRAIIGTMVFSFGRIGAVVGMNVGDYYMSGRHRMFRLQEKGGKVHQMPAHHHAIDYVEDYLDAAGLWGQQQAPLFQAVDNRKQLTGNRLDRKKALEMIKRRARAAGLPETTCCHTFRATAITTYLLNGGDVENARQMAAHQSSQTTRLYDRRGDQVTLDEIERIRI